MIPTGEVVTMVTDYLLAATGFGAAMWLWKSADGVPGRWWAVAFVATGVAAVLGGTSHGYAPVIDEQTHGLVWRLTYVTVGIANFCVLYGAALAAVPPARRKPDARRTERPFEAFDWNQSVLLLQHNSTPKSAIVNLKN